MSLESILKTPTSSSEILSQAASQLKDVAGDRAVYEARMLFSKALGMTAVEILTKGDFLLSSEQERNFLSLLSRRVASEPMAYILGEKEFLQFTFKVGPGVLIPRPETEVLVLEIVKRIQSDNRKIRAIDLGTGSGCIALSLKKILGDQIEMHALDRSSRALDYAKENANRLQVGEIHFHERSWSEPLTLEFDWVISNPPYIPDSEWDRLQKDIREYEPREALTAGVQGLNDYFEIYKNWWPKLKSNGFFALETFDENQRKKIKEIFISARAFEEVEAHLFVSKS